MAQPFRLVTRYSRNLDHHMRPQSAWTSRSAFGQTGGAKLRSTFSLVQAYETRRSARSWMSLEYCCASTRSRAINGQRTTLQPETSRWHEIPRRDFSTSFVKYAKPDEDLKKNVADHSEKPAEASPGPPKTTIAASAKAVTQRLKSLTPPALKENIYTLPNLLTTTRILTAPVISWALLHSQPGLAFGLFAYSSITDLVDGYLARRYKSGTVLGSILDPFADKLLMTLTTVTLYSIGTFPWWLTLIILGRDGGLALSALYFRWISLPPPRTMTRYWDFSLPSAEVRPTEISKINTLLQFLLVADAVLLPVLPVSLVEAWNLWGVFEGWMMLVAGTTVWSGLSYVFTRDAIRFIGQNEGENNRKDEQ